MNLVIDSGNSAAKVGIFNHLELVEKRAFSSQQELQAFLAFGSFENILVSSVREDVPLLASWAPQTAKTFTLNKDLPLPVTSLYQTPGTLGMDRLAGICGAVQLFPDSDNLVIDAGTCITYDFVDRNRRFHGGGISPGLMMRFQAVHTFTARLPLVTPKADPALIGNSTETCIQSGVVNGIVAEMHGIAQRYEEKFPGLRVILCGGDTRFFEKQLKASIFAIPDLVLIGLNSILIHNVNRS